MLILVFVFAPIGYVFYWTMIYPAFKSRERYFGWDNYSSLRKFAWIFFCVMFAIFTVGSFATHDREFYYNFIAPAIQVGFTLGHVHFLSIPKSSWDNSKFPTRRR